MAKKMSSSFQSRLKDLRKQKGLTQIALANALPNKVTAVSISQWETGQTVPKMNNLTALAEFFDVGIEWLSSGRSLSSDIDIELLNSIAIPNIQANLTAEWKDSYLVLDSSLLKKKDKIGWHKIEGDAMSPFLPNGSIVVLDTQDLKVTDGELYLINYENIYRVKQLSQTRTGYIVKSFNEAYQEECYSPQSFSKEISILGCVILKITNN